MRRAGLWLTALALAATAACAQEAAKDGASAPALPPPLVHLRAVDPTIVQDIRYATSRNFTGTVVPGYQAAECILTRAAAEALQRVQADLKPHQLALKVYDCYRPRRAVAAFMTWVKTPDSRPGPEGSYHPNVPRQNLVTLGYIAATSGHSRADTVDLTLIALPPEGQPPADPGDGADCTQPPAPAGTGNTIDMGTAFDCFDPKSHTASPKATDKQRGWRNVLVRAMAKRGFRNYDKEWWHFTFGPGKGPSYDVPVRAMPAAVPSPPKEADKTTP